MHRHRKSLKAAEEKGVERKARRESAIRCTAMLGNVAIGGTRQIVGARSTAVH